MVHGTLKDGVMLRFKTMPFMRCFLFKHAVESLFLHVYYKRFMSVTLDITCSKLKGYNKCGYGSVTFIGFRKADLDI